MKKMKGNALAQSAPMASEKDMEMEDGMHMDTLMKAHELMTDPVKMKRVHALAGRKHKAITSLNDIKNALNEKFGPKAKKEGPAEGETVAHEKGESKLKESRE
jgi:hypothetical protein